MHTDPAANYDLLTSKLHALIEIAEVLAARLELTLLLQSVIDKTIEILEPAEFGVVFLWDEQTKLLRPQAAAGQRDLDLQAFFELGQRENESITGSVFVAFLTNSVNAEVGIPAAVSIRILDNDEEARNFLPVISGFVAGPTRTPMPLTPCYGYECLTSFKH